MNLDFAKVCGKHSAIYEAYYKQIDPKGSGAIEAMTAAKFLKKSGLSDVVLSRIWDLSDPNGKGFLDKPGFFVALKLVSLAQAGQVINMSNIYTDTTNPPKVGDLPKIMPPRVQTAPVSGAGVAGGDWSIKIIDRLKYEQLFESLKPVGGMLAGNKVKGVLMDSKLPMDTLGKIWDLADQDKDGNLDKHEFIVAMHLVYQTLEKRVVPDVLPPELRKAGGGPPPKPAPPVIANVGASHAASMPRAPSGEGFGDGGFVADFPKDIPPPPSAIPQLPAAVPPMQRVPIVPPQPLISTDPLIPIGAPTSLASAGDWVVTPAELKRYEIIFRDSDRDKDGLVSGLEVKNVFLQSGVQQNCLAHVWALCDTNQSGKLTLEQFALAMWMVERKQKGLEPPQVLTSNMVPPSMRGIVAGVDLQSQEPKPTYSNPELEMISKEIEELAKERRALETDIAQKEADIRIKSGEVRSLQSELDTLSATLKQLEHQRGEAQKRLDDLKVQSTEYQEALANIHLDISQKRSQVTKIREQCQKQEETINEQEGELNSKRSEMQKLKDEEAALQKEYEENNKELQNLTKHLQNTQLQISSVRSMVTQLLETQRQMTDALLMCRAAIESNEADLVTEYQLKIEPDFDEARKVVEKKIEITKADPFEDGVNNAIKATNGFTTNGFGSDPFGAANTTNEQRSRIGTGFDDSFNSGFDAFGSGSTGFGGQQNKDPFGSNAFAATKSNAITPEPGKDDFGSDPFAALHAPTGQGQVLSPNTQKSGPPPRPESPSPALPPKKSKVPPPRPAPPRPLQGPTRPTQPSGDAFGSTANSSGGFADFADFDNKFQSLAPTLALNSRSKSSLLFHTSTSSSTFTSNSLSLSATTAAAAATTTTTTLNSATNHLNRSNNNNTSLQPSSMFAANIKSDIKASAVAAKVTKLVPPTPPPPPTVATPIIYGPTDFSDDPFKDYRYEDPFNIKDPFADDDNSNSEENIFKDDFSSNDDDSNDQVHADQKQKEGNLIKEPTKLNTSMKSDSCNTSQTFGSARSNANTPLSNDFLEQFDSFNMNSSSVPSSTQTIDSFGSAAGTTTTTTTAAAEVVATTTTSSISVNSRRNTPVSSLGNVFDNFADFDAFSTKSTKSSAGNKIEIPAANAINVNCNINNKDINKEAPSLSSIELNNENAGNDIFFDAFNDNFLNTTKVHTSKNSTRNANILDAFGSETTLNASKSRATFGRVDAFGSVPNIVDASPAFNDAFVIKSAKVFDDDFSSDGNAFEDDFFKDKSSVSPSADVNLNFSKLDMEKTKATTTTKAITDNFAKFDAFNDDDDEDDDDDDDANNFSTALNNSINLEGGAAFVIGGDKLNKVQNNTMPLHKMHNSEAGAKLPSKYAADYSNPDSFPNDLEEAIKRSMLEK